MDGQLKLVARGHSLSDASIKRQSRPRPDAGLLRPLKPLIRVLFALLDGEGVLRSENVIAHRIASLFGLTRADCTIDASVELE